MQLLAVLIIVGAMGLVVYILFLRKSGAEDLASDESYEPDTPQADSGNAEKQELIRKSLPWLEERWAIAGRELESGPPTTFPAWFFKEITPAQKDCIASWGVSFQGGTLTRGQASDVIGLFSEPENDDGLLAFFRIPATNETQAREAIRCLKADSEKMEQWENRSATAFQKEFLRSVGIRVPRGLSFKDAEKMIKAVRKNPELADKVAEFNNWQSIWDELGDAELRREVYAIKKPTKEQVRRAFEAMRAEGTEPAEIANDLDEFVEKLIELYPELEREG